MSAIDFSALPGTLVRPFVVAIGHLPILIVVLLMTPIWIRVAIQPRTHGDIALKFVSELRGWGREVVANSASPATTRRVGAK